MKLSPLRPPTVSPHLRVRSCKLCAYFCPVRAVNRTEPTFPSYIYKGKTVIGYCEKHRSDLFITTTCGSFTEKDYVRV